MGYRHALMAAALTMALSNAAEAQDVLRVPVDRIVAIVGDTPIPASRIEEQLNTYQSQGGEIPTDPAALAALRSQVLNSIIEEELVVQAAVLDTTVQVTDEDVQSAVDEIMQNIRDRYPSVLDLQRDLQSAGFKSVDQYRLWVTEQQRRELLRDALLQQLRQTGKLEPLPPTESEILAACERLKDQYPNRPATVSFRQIVVASQPDSAALAAAFARADSVRRQLLEGADFAAMARAHSDDMGTRERGGSLGWVRRGQGLVREFEDVAFRLQPGFYSLPVYTPFGFHIIQVQRSEPASVQVRHILFSPEFTDENRAEARARADSVVTQLRAGVSFDSLAREHHDRTEERVVENIPRENLPLEYQLPLAAAEPGQIVGPIELDRGSGRTLYAVVVFEEARPEGPAECDDFRDQLQSSLAEENAIRRYIETLRDATYVEIIP